jgi:SAM-dependent methyltransferase
MHVTRGKARRKKDYMVRYYPESRFGGFTDIDGTIAFYTRVQSLVEPSHLVLDVGCGRGAHQDDPVPVRRALRVFQGRCKRVIGVDVDGQAADNPFLDEFRRIKGSGWPVEDASVDVCIADNVVEHLRDPPQFFAECRRTLRSGGYLCIRTPNARNYISVFAKSVPNAFHKAVLGKVLYAKKDEEDIFPTRYRCNTKRRLRRRLDEHGFEHCVYGYEAEPYHLGFSRLAYVCGVLHQRLAPNGLKTTIFAFARRS